MELSNILYNKKGMFSRWTFW